MLLCNDFSNKLVDEITILYFRGLLSREESKYFKMKYIIECFSNGVLTYSQLIIKLGKSCKETNSNIHIIVSSYIEDFNGYYYEID